MRRVANALIDAFIENGRCEFMEEFAAQYPARVFFEEILGLPADQISGSFDAVQRIVMNPGSTLEPLMVLMPWCQEVLTARRDEQRRDDVLDALVHGMVNGERPLTLTEQVQMLITLLIGGFETTSSAIGSAVLHLATDMKLQHALSATGADIETACEEFLRFEAPVPAIARTATRDTELTGCPIKKGERVLIYYGAANRDPAAWHDPDRLDIARENAKRHVTFGKGIHVCLGANLARLELRVALTTIVQRLTKIELDPSPEKSLSWRNGQTRGPLHLPITFRPKS
jgi:cytochrome P450